MWTDVTTKDNESRVIIIDNEMSWNEIHFAYNDYWFPTTKMGSWMKSKPMILIDFYADQT